MNFGQQNVSAVIKVSKSYSILGKIEDFSETFLSLGRRDKHTAEGVSSHWDSKEILFKCPNRSLISRFYDG